jgi:hypothetical protein
MITPVIKRCLSDLERQVQILRQVVDRQTYNPVIDTSISGVECELMTLKAAIRKEETALKQQEYKDTAVQTKENSNGSR